MLISATSSGGSPAVSARTHVRPEIQALRATAVLLVLVGHLWPAVLPGGYVGVDVFFAISGFLITSLLLREIERTGRLSLSGFWARRARRILPAALAALVVCAAATVLFVPVTRWPQFFTELRASSVYVQNWQLASSAVDYFSAGQAPSPVQHYWSLSTEEQFYLAWPIVLVAAVALSTRRVVRLRRRALAVAIAVPTVVSLAYSLRHTHEHPQAAYFITPTRAWEFGAGGLLALLPQAERSPAVAPALLSWAGLAAIAVAALAYGRGTAFPGEAALLPVLGTLAVIRAGIPVRRWAPSRALRLPPVQFVGDISYSVYLWHWPLIVLAPFVIGRRLDTGALIAVFVITLLAAWGSKRLVEDPIRGSAFLVRRGPALTLGLAALGTALVFALSELPSAYVDAQIRRSASESSRLLASDRPCFGAGARDPGLRCDERRWGTTVVPTPLEAKQPGPGCTMAFRLGGKRVCEFGAPAAGASATVALIGDSHATHWAPALDRVARANRWHGLLLGHHGCPLSLATRDLVEPDRSSCIRWKQAVLAWLTQHPEVRFVVVSQLSGGSGVVPEGGRSAFDTAVAGYTAAWRALPASVERVFVIRDTPKVHGNTDSCVQEAMGDGRRPGPACAVARRGALDRDPAAVAAARTGSSRVSLVDLTRLFCDPRRCDPVIGGALVFKDPTHLTRVYASTLAPYLGRALAERPRARRATAAAAEPRCFGAASRDPRHACHNPRLRLMVRPSLRAAERPFEHCRLLYHLVDKQVCAFGVPAEGASATVALIGDSHAGHWRPAFDLVARAHRWHGISLGHSGCPLSLATRALVGPNRAHCRRWKRGVLRWFRRHPEVRTVFVSQLSGGSGVVPTRGRSEYATSMAGYAAAWHRLPRSVKRIVVVRDTPKLHGSVRACVRRAIARRVPAGAACAVPRAGSLDPDPAFAAARRSRSKRVRTVDLTRFFCGRRRCFPVVGGALVLKDPTHMTGLWTTTLAPYLRRAVDHAR